MRTFKDSNYRILLCLFIVPVLIVSIDACFGLPGPSFSYIPPMSNGGGAYSSGGGYSSGSYSSGGYAAPYASKARMLAPDSPRLSASLDNAIYEYDARHNYSSAAGASDGLNDGGCSHRFVDRKLACATPIETRTPSTEADCKRICVDYLLSRCASYRFDIVASTCELYDMIPPLPVTGNSHEDSDIFPFHDDNQNVEYDSADINENSYKKKNHRNKRFTLQNGVPSAIGSQKSSTGFRTEQPWIEHSTDQPKNQPNDLNSILKLPGFTPIGCTPSMASEFGSVYATVDVQCYKNAGQPLATGSSDIFAPLVAQLKNSNALAAPLASAGNGNDLLQSLFQPLPQLSNIFAPQPQQQLQGAQPVAMSPMQSFQTHGQQAQLLTPSSLGMGSQQSAPNPHQFVVPSQPLGGTLFTQKLAPLGQQQRQALQAQFSAHQGQTLPGSRAQFSSSESLGGFRREQQLSNNPSLFSVEGSLPNEKLSNRYRSAARAEFADEFVDDSAIVIPEMPDCVDGSRARVQIIDGVAVVGVARPLATIQIASAETCLHLCRANAHLDGTRFARVCRAAVFDRVAGRCAILDDAITPNGELNYAPNAQSVYFEKFCIPESELPLGCDDVVQRIPQHTLDPRATGTGAVLTASSQTDCVRRCITAQKRLGFECSSISYYFDWEKNNCYLSRFTRVNRPDLYVGEHKQLVDYLELAPCMRRAQQNDQIFNAKNALPTSSASKRPSDPFSTLSSDYDSLDETHFNVRRGAPPRQHDATEARNGFSTPAQTQNDYRSNQIEERELWHNGEGGNNGSDRALVRGTTLRTGSMPGSTGSNSAPIEKPQWSEWSECDTESRIRSRYRACSTTENNIVTQKSSNESAFKRESNEEPCEPDIEMVSCDEAKRADKSASKYGTTPIKTNFTESRQHAVKSPRHVPTTSHNKIETERGKRRNEAQNRADETEATSANARGCDARTRCCSKVTRFGVVVARGGDGDSACTIGYRILGDGSTVACMPDDC